MKRFAVNRHGRLVFPCNFFPHLDFAALKSLAQFEAVVRRDFVEKAPEERAFRERLRGRAYDSRYALLRDLTLHLRNLHRYTLALYETQVLRWADVPRRRDDVYMPALHVASARAPDGETLEACYAAARSTFDADAEDAIFALLFDVYRAGRQTLEETRPRLPSVAEHVATPDACAYRLARFDPDFPRYDYDDIVDYAHPVPELEALMRHAMVLRNAFPWRPADVIATPIGRLEPHDAVVVCRTPNEPAREFLRRTRRPTAGARTSAAAPTRRTPARPVAPIDVRRELATRPRLEAVAVRKGERVCTNEDIVRNAACHWSPLSADDIRTKTGIEQRTYTEHDLADIALDAARAALVKSGRHPEEIGAVLFCSCTSTQTMPSIASWIAAQLGILQAHAAYDLLAACAGMVYGVADSVRLMQQSGRPVLVVTAEKFSDKVGTVRASRMLFGDGAAALVIGPVSGDAPLDIEVFQTYASGPTREVEAIVWPNPDFDNDVTVYGPDVRSLVKRYLAQMLAELRRLPGPDGAGGSLLEAIELVVPHQANKTMVTQLATEAGIPAQQLYFNIDRLGNTSAASIPIALHDAIRDGVIDRPMRVFAPGFGAGAVGGYVVMRVDPGVAA